MKTPHTAEYFRERRAKRRAEAIAAGTFGISARYKRPNAGRAGAAAVDMDMIPPEVYERGKIMKAMMRTPVDQWKPEWLSEAP